MKDFPNLNVFLDKHRLAQQNNSKEVRFTMNELNDAVHDIHKLMASVYTTQEDQAEVKTLLNNLLEQLKELNSSDADGGNF
jgi:uncharacterized protein YgfB (UPF0149 family)